MLTLFASRLLQTSAIALLGMASAHAIEYNAVQPQQSTIQFVYKQMGVAVEGKFKRFNSQLSFDPAKPTAAKANLEIDLGSIDVGAPEGNQEVAGKPWFNTPAFPTARFVSGTVKALGGNRYEVAGKLTIKGKTQDVVVPATFTPQGNTGVFDGGFTLKRADFAIGEGSWAKFDIVANEVQVKFRLSATGK